jgi:UPF0271 protein
MEDSGPQERVVVDANVVIHSRAQFPFETVVVPSSVRGEILSEMSKLKMEKLDVKVVEPSDSVLEKVESKSVEINSPTSDQDEEALALSLDKNLVLVTDDKALQNLALHLDADFNSFNTEKVSEKREWVQVCDNCGAEVSSLPCSRCGSQKGLRKRD